MYNTMRSRSYLSNAQAQWHTGPRTGSGSSFLTPMPTAVQNRIQQAKDLRQAYEPMTKITQFTQFTTPINNLSANGGFDFIVG